MGRFIAALLALAALLVAIVLLAPNLIPAKAYKGRLEAAASAALGREVTIAGPLAFKIIPTTAFSAEDLTIANAPGFAGPHLAKVRRADIGVKLIPLFSGRVDITRFVLTEPDLNLEKTADGRVNWNLARAGEGAEDGREVKDVRLGDVRLADGRAVYVDGAAAKTYEASDIDVEAKLESLEEPLEVEGTMLFEGAPARLKLVLANPADLIAERKTNLKLDATLGEATIGADLALAAGGAFSYAGPVNLNAPDLPALAALFDVKLEEAPGFDKLSVSGAAEGTATAIALADAAIGFDAIEAAGDLTLDWSGDKPMATGALAAETLDLRPYLPPPAADAAGFPEWSNDKIDFSGLRNLNADLDVSADKVFLNELEAGQTRVNIKIANGRLTAAIPQIAFYGGAGSGTLVVDATRAAPSIAGKFAMNSVEAQSFAADLMRLDRLLGLGGFKLEFSAAGASQAAIMKSLDGKGGFEVEDGAIKGVNIAKLAGAVAKLYEGGLANAPAIAAAVAEAQRPDEKTDFSKFLSDFSIADGMVRAPTISLQGPHLTMTGVGRVDLPGQTLDLRLLPKATTTATGEQGRAIVIPVKVGGTFAKPSLSVDLEALLRGRAEQTLRGVLDRALAPNEGEGVDDPAADLLKGILGGGRAEPETAPPADGATGAAAEPDPAEAVIGGALDRLFGRKPAPEEQPDEPDSAPQ
jgi:AsmA protein